MAKPKRVPVPSAKAAPTSPPPPNPPRPARKPARRRELPADGRLRVLIAGASGMIGTELQAQLRAAGHTPLKLVRRPPTANDEFSWAPDAKILDFRLLDTVDAVVNLSGASLTHVPWTAAYKTEILRSRVKATEALVEAMTMTEAAPPVFLSGSAVGFYGDRPGEELTEASPAGTGFFAEVVAAWEAAATLAPPETRTVLLRTGVVIGPGGALAPLRLATKFGMGARIGAGTQVWPWVSLHDEVAAIVHLLTSTIDGPVNLAGPTPATATAITTRIATDLHRPHVLRIPQKVIEVAAGELGREMLLPSQLVVPERLLADGFVFRHQTVEQAVDAALAAS